jgi:hypothetical protein
MKLKTSLLLSWAVLACTTNLAHAEATEDEANRLSALFETYLTDTEGVVSVELDGDGYKVIFDLAPLTGEANKAASLVGESGGSFKVSPIEFKMASQGDGKWQVVEDQPITFNMEIKGQVTAEEKVESLKATGIFDEKLGTFSTVSGEMKNITVTEKLMDPSGTTGDVSATIKGIKIDQTATASGDSAVDIKSKFTIDSLTENLSMPGKPETGGAPMNFVVNAASGTLDLNGKAMKPKSLLDLLAFFVSHQTKELITKDQADLKTKLGAGLPLWENVQETGKISTVKINSQFGEFGIDTVDIGLEMNGVVKDGKFRESVGLTGMNVPAALVPPWATKLVPKNTTFDFTVSGFDLASPAQLILSQLDLSKDKPLPDGFEQVLMPSFMPKGAVDVALNPTTMSNDTYNVKVEGSMTAGPAAMPSGKAKINAKGLDEIMKIIQAAPPEAGLGSGLAVVIGAKGIAKAEADGSLTWNVEATPDGKVLVNGIDPSTLGK